MSLKTATRAAAAPRPPPARDDLSHAGGHDQDEKLKSPFTIKSFPHATRKLAVECARRQGLTMGEWLDRAVRTQAEVDKGNQVIPPGVSKVSVAVQNPVKQPLDLSQGVQLSYGSGMGMNAVADMIRAIASLNAATPDRPLNQRAMASISALIDSWAREVRGAPPPSTRKPKVRDEALLLEEKA